MPVIVATRSCIGDNDGDDSRAPARRKDPGVDRPTATRLLPRGQRSDVDGSLRLPLASVGVMSIIPGRGTGYYDGDEPLPAPDITGLGKQTTRCLVGHVLAEVGVSKRGSCLGDLPRQGLRAPPRHHGGRRAEREPCRRNRIGIDSPPEASRGRLHRACRLGSSPRLSLSGKQRGGALRPGGSEGFSVSGATPVSV